MCNRVCINPMTNRNHCGASGFCRDDNADSLDFSGVDCSQQNLFCIEGRCGCPEDQVLCDNVCINPLDDRTHCGALGACNNEDSSSPHFRGIDCSQQNMFCVEGQCGCSETQVLCDGSCIDPNTSNTFCGAKGTCSSDNIDDENYRGTDCGDMRCDNKVCKCPDSYILCNHKCVNPLIDSTYCGAKGNCTGDDPNADDFAGTSCGNLLCSQGECKCPDPYIQCDGQCVDPINDMRYCGAKGTCSSTDKTDPNYKGDQCQGGSMCNQSQCACPNDYILCNGRCVDPKADLEYCGAKGQCSETNPNSENYAGQKCVGGASCNGTVCECPNGGVLCNGRCIDPKNDLEYCGARGLCSEGNPSSENYAGQKCVGGASCNGTACECPNGGVLCDGQCINPTTDSTYCGANADCSLYSTCLTAQSCTNGTCQCPKDTTLCGNECVSLDFDANHCGKCNKACKESESCMNGTCKITNCNGENMALCPVGDSFSCLNISNDKKNCGRCGNVCDPNQFANVYSASCTDGECIYQCNDGYTACNAAGTICQDLNNDINNCGICNRKCASNQKCQNGQCIDNCPNGCLSTSGCVNTASQCGPSCFNCYSVNTNNLQSASCSSSGQCQYTCAPGYEWNGSYCYYTGNCPDYYYNDGSQCIKNTDTSCRKTGKTLTFNCKQVKSSTGVCGPDGECECVALNGTPRYFCPMSDGYYCSTYCNEGHY